MIGRIERRLSAMGFVSLLVVVCLLVVFVSLNYRAPSAHAQSPTGQARFDAASGFQSVGTQTARFMAEVVVSGPGPTFISQNFPPPENFVAGSVFGTFVASAMTTSELPGVSKTCFTERHAQGAMSLQIITNASGDPNTTHFDDVAFFDVVISPASATAIVPWRMDFPKGLNISSGLTVQVYDDGCKPTNGRVALEFVRKP